MKRRMLILVLCLTMGLCLLSGPALAAEEPQDVLSDRMSQLAADGGYVQEWYPDQKTCLVSVGGADALCRIETAGGETLLEGYGDLWRTDRGYARIGYYQPGTMDSAGSAYEAMNDPSAVDAYAELYDFSGRLVEQTKLSGGYGDWSMTCASLYPRSYDYYIDTSALYAEGGYTFESDKVTVEPAEGGFVVSDGQGQELGQVFIPQAETLSPFLAGDLLGFYQEGAYGYSFVRWYYLDI